MKRTFAVASGKGGAGKTTVAVGLALALADRGQSVRLLDCDVEEPNCHVQLGVSLTATEPATAPVPEVDTACCDGCGACAQACRFHSLAVVRKQVLVFPQLCHACGACLYACPQGAIREVPRRIGLVRQAEAESITLVDGLLDVGEAMASPLIRQVRQREAGTEVTILDGPPGTSCSLLAATGGADHVLLVAEATPFGLHDLALASEAVRLLGLPVSVVLNRCRGTAADAQAFLAERDLPLAGCLPEDRRVAECAARGGTPYREVPGFGAAMRDLLARLLGEAA